jgi:D-glycero-alpha-D-manno-heptose 1-phosphate guanylyltransferase
VTFRLPANLEHAPDVAILCGGAGTRLRAAVADRPKALAEVAGRPFLAWLLDLLDAQGFGRVVLCTGYRAEQIEAEFGASYKGLQLRYSPEPTSLGTGGALRFALPLLASETILGVNGDSYCQSDLGQFWRDHAESGAAASMLLSRVADSSRFGSVQVTGQGLVAGFQEKAAAAGPGWINAGIYLVRRALLEAIPSGVPCSLEREIFPAWVKTGLRGVKATGDFVDIGTPDSYRAANELFGQYPGTLPASRAQQTAISGVDL